MVGFELKEEREGLASLTRSLSSCCRSRWSDETQRRKLKQWPLSEVEVVRDEGTREKLSKLVTFQLLNRSLVLARIRPLGSHMPARSARRHYSDGHERKSQWITSISDPGPEAVFRSLSNIIYRTKQRDSEDNCAYQFRGVLRGS